MAVTGAISSASPSARPMPARIAAIRPSQPAQAGRPGSSASIHGQASQSNSSLEAEPQRDQRKQRQAQRLEEHRAELGGEELAGGGAGGIEDHALRSLPFASPR